MDEELRKAIGKIIRKHRQNKAMSLEKLAEEANLDGTNIGRFERGEKLPNLKSFLQIVIALEMEQNDYLHFVEAILREED